MPISLLESRDQRACDQPSVNSPHNNPSLSSVLMLPKPTSPSTTPSTESSTEISSLLLAELVAELVILRLWGGGSLAWSSVQVGSSRPSSLCVMFDRRSREEG